MRNAVGMKIGMKMGIGNIPKYFLCKNCGMRWELKKIKIKNGNEDLCVKIVECGGELENEIWELENEIWEWE